MCLKQGLGWSDPLDAPSPTIEVAIEQAAVKFKAKFKRWPNFVRVSLEEAAQLGNRLNGLLIIADQYAGSGYRLLIGYSEEVKHEQSE